MGDYIISSGLVNRTPDRTPLTSIAKIRRLCIWTALHRSAYPRCHAEEPTVLEADDCTGLVLQDAGDIETGDLARRIQADKIAPVDEDGVDFDGVVGLGAYEAVHCREWDSCKMGASGNRSYNFRAVNHDRLAS